MLQTEKKDTVNYPNNIRKWMNDNLTREQYRQANIDFIELLGVSNHTLINYLSGKTQIGMNDATKVYEYLLPFAPSQHAFSLHDLL